jgi:hypothetical protein
MEVGGKPAYTVKPDAFAYGIPCMECRESAELGEFWDEIEERFYKQRRTVTCTNCGTQKMDLMRIPAENYI